jgi:hypothetical protein
MTRIPSTFTDGQGVLRRVRLDTALMERARDELGVDLMEIYTGQLVTRLRTDPVMLVKLAYLLTEAGDEPADYARAVGPVIGDLCQAVIEGIASFFDGLTNGAASRIARASQETLDRATTLAMTRLAGPSDEELTRLMDQVLARLSSGGPSGDSRGSSGSTPDPSPSGSSPAWPKPDAATTGTSSPACSPA